MDFMTIGITILAMAIVWMAYLGMAELLMTKIEVSQVARKYLLRMETVGYLEEADRTELVKELSQLGVSKVNLSGTTMQPVPYGEPIYLKVHGTMQGMALEEERIWSDGFSRKDYTVGRELVSTAKN